MFWLKMLIATIALALILIGIWHEKKLIAFEDWLADRIGYIAAKVVIWFRHLKKGN